MLILYFNGKIAFLVALYRAIFKHTCDKMEENTNFSIVITILNIVI